MEKVRRRRERRRRKRRRLLLVPFDVLLIQSLHAVL